MNNAYRLPPPPPPSPPWMLNTTPARQQMPPPPRPGPLHLAPIATSSYPLQPPAESRTLTTFPTTSLPSPRILPVHSIRPFPVRYPKTSYDPPPEAIKTPEDAASRIPIPIQEKIQTNRWLCCQCLSSRPQKDQDPIGTIHIEGPPFPAHIGTENSYIYATCYRPECRHIKCVNCVLYAGPLCRDFTVKTGLIRTVGGLYCSPRYLDPVYWECLCGEWKRNKFTARASLLAGESCRNEQGCRFKWVGRGLLRGDSVVMNRYGQRLGSADQRMAFKDGPWDWQRRGLGDERCALVKGVREAMRRGGRRGEEMMMERKKVWKEGEVVPDYGYRRPPPLDENDARENDEYENSYLAGMPLEGSDKGKGKGDDREIVGDWNSHLLHFGMMIGSRGGDGGSVGVDSSVGGGGLFLGLGGGSSSFSSTLSHQSQMRM
ncbi:hypothetical protein QBC38DRAFT_482232 [Podospora fimiseda]|uniref:Uncharacterized protein n=1 Tax=Podospora fimiseda TaxID=252190 RepID=A0AAN7BLS2_9PEZI|nr:hypothetical protein QBC38DRAFT_482232 [Podospora fimiseda]